MTVEQWLADLEEKAKAATPGPWEMKKDCDESDHMQVRDSAGVVCETPLWGFEYPEQWENGRFIAAANPSAVLRLVGMVRHLTVGCDCDAEACQYGHCTPTCRLQMAYKPRRPAMTDCPPACTRLWRRKHAPRTEVVGLQKQASEKSHPAHIFTRTYHFVKHENVSRETKGDNMEFNYTGHKHMWEWLAERPGLNEDDYFQAFPELSERVKSAGGFACAYASVKARESVDSLICNMCPLEVDTTRERDCHNMLYPYWTSLCELHSLLKKGYYDDQKFLKVVESKISDVCKRIAHIPVRGDVPHI